MRPADVVPGRQVVDGRGAVGMLVSFELAGPPGASATILWAEHGSGDGPFVQRTASSMFLAWLCMPLDEGVRWLA